MVSDMELKQPSKLKYPKSVAFIVSNEFCERFNYYGMRTVLVLYLTRNLGYNDDGATILYHVFTSLAYLFPVFGAIIADSWLGRFKTILYLSIVYAIGSVLIAVGAIPVLHLPANLVTIFGLILIAIGTGGIKPCVAAFGGDQFQIPEQTKALATFFSIFYMAINAGSLISTTLTPILREDVHCFGQQECFSMAFGVPGLLMVIAIGIFIGGKPFYRIKKSSGNMLVLVSKCIGNAVKSRFSENQNKSHWLDYAEPAYGKRLVDDIKMLLKILVLFIPVPIFWALLDQQGSRWTFQATHMNGEVGGILIKPDQMQVLNPLLIVGFIPLFNWIFYPLMEKVGIRTPLQKMTVGMILAAASFCLSGFLELKLEADGILSTDRQIRVINGLNCSYQISSDSKENSSYTLRSGEMWLQPNDRNGTKYQINPIENSSCLFFMDSFTFSMNESENSSIHFMTGSNSSGQILKFNDLHKQLDKYDSTVKILANTPNVDKMELKNIKIDYSKIIFTNSTESFFIPIGTYEIIIKNKSIEFMEFGHSGVYTIVIVERGKDNYILENHVIQKPNSISMLWQIPQYIVITIAEIMFSVTGLEFSFTQAPESMKSVLQACWLLNVSLGNVIVIIVTEVKYFQSQATEFFFFAFIMIIDMLLFICLSVRYKYRDTSDIDGDTLNDLPKKSDLNQGVIEINKKGNENFGFSSEL